MKFQVILGALASLAIAASAAPTTGPVSSVKLSQVQVKDLADVLKVQDKLAADQTISCTVAYTLALSMLTPFHNFHQRTRTNG
jgi:hypothetical protein